ncbi:hypothetical protein MMC31_007557 [Peltigera leucophlebia]|nr:hypothetical protein [Peltigera leucophlebia]
MQTIFCSVLTFNHVANKLSPNLKDIVRIKKKTPSNPLTLARVKPHNYDQDSNEKDTKIPPSSPFSSTICSPVFVRSAHDTDDVSCKLFVALPAHQAQAKNNRDELQKKHSNIFGKQAIYHLFPYKAHCLSCYRNTPIVATEQVAIGQYYVQLELDKQTEFHVDNMEKEIECLHTLVEIELQKVASMEQNIVFLRSKEVERKNAICHQLAAGFHNTGTGYLRQPWFGYKVESINLTNDSGSERGPIRASHTWPSPIIQIKDERIRSLNRQPTRQPTCQPYIPERRTILSNFQPDQYKYQAPASVSVGYDQYALSTAPQTTQDHGSWSDGEYGRPSPYASRDDRWRDYPLYQDERYEYDPRALYASSYEYNYRRHYNSAYEYKQRPVSDKDYEAERKPIWGHAGKDEPALAQEFECKTISACEPVQGLPPAPTPLASASAGQKFKSNPPDGQECLALAAKDPKCQALNPDTSREKVQIVQVVQEVDKPRSCSLSPAFNEPTNSKPTIPLLSDTQYAVASDLAKLYNQDIK